MLLGVVADDLTGATDVALMLQRAGMRVVRRLRSPRRSTSRACRSARPRSTPRFCWPVVCCSGGPGDVTAGDPMRRGGSAPAAAAPRSRRSSRSGVSAAPHRQPGGCSGLRYQLFFDDRTLDGDAVQTYDGFSVVVDRMSVPYLGGAAIDFVDTIEKQGFTIDNPTATGSCACGDSFI